jgi:integrase
MSQIFKAIWRKTPFWGKTSKMPTCHALRHTFAVNSLRQCLARGDNFDSFCAYLSRYMGHKSVRGTLYYIHMAEQLMPLVREQGKSIEDVIHGVLRIEE